MTTSPNSSRNRTSPLSTTSSSASPISGRPNAVEVDLTALTHNVEIVRNLVGSKTRLFAAVKANAYGLGLERVAAAAVGAGVDALATADPADAIRLREHGIQVPILLYPGALIEAEMLHLAADLDVTLTITDTEAARIASQRATRPIQVFLKVDVGMERLGSAPREIASLAELVGTLPRIELGGVYAHMHVGSGRDPESYFRWQIQRFEGVLAELRRQAIVVPVTMASSSPALALLGRALFDAADPGHLIYGMAPPVPRQVPGLRTVLHSIRTRIIQAKTIERHEFADDAPLQLRPGLRIGILPIGRADGLQFLTTGEVLVRGRRCPIVGKLSLEHVRIDISDVPEAGVGDEVVIIGKQGGEMITLEEVCRHTGLDEVGTTVAMGRSIPRHYIERNGL